MNYCDENLFCTAPAGKDTDCEHYRQSAVTGACIFLSMAFTCRCMSARAIADRRGIDIELPEGDD